MAQFSQHATMEREKSYHGSLIAFEGPENLVSTQLRLLPSSPQLLVLPSLDQYIKQDSSNTRFDPRSYVKSVHQAAQARHDTALQFLNSSNSDSKRLVFLNGGTASAVSQCISVIGERQASGDLILAEAIYKNIAAEGARGLEQDAKHENQQALEKLNSERGDLDDTLWEHDEDDPITKAMRAADALYKETEFLQPIDCYIRTRPRSLSLPMLEWANELGQASPFFVFGSSPSEGAPSVFDEDEEEPLDAEEDSNRRRSLKSQQGSQRIRSSVPRRSVSSMAEAIHARDSRSTIQVLPSTTIGNESPPATPEGVVYGEARLVQMHAAKSQDLRKVRSLDDMELTEARRRRISVQYQAQPHIASPIDSPEARSRHLSIAEDPYSPNNLMHFPVAKFVKAQTTTIRKSPTFVKALPKPARDTYVHQGTDVADFSNEHATSEGEFEPVLPLLEDLVVHFTSFTPDYVLSSVIQSYKDGLYPLLGNTSESFGTAETDSCPSTPRTADLFDLEVGKTDGLYTVPEEPSADEASDYDPYAPHGNDVRAGAKAPLRQPSTPSPKIPQPPMPSQSDALKAGAKFYDFSTPGYPNAILTQNALRSVLEGYYPQHQGAGYLQYNPLVLSDMNILWRPMFQDFEAQENKPNPHTADLILAIGCQKGVKSELVAAVTAQIEKLGQKPNGLSRSGRLDIR